MQSELVLKGYYNIIYLNLSENCLLIIIIMNQFLKSVFFVVKLSLFNNEEVISGPTGLTLLESGPLGSNVTDA